MAYLVSLSTQLSDMLDYRVNRGIFRASPQSLRFPPCPSLLSVLCALVCTVVAGPEIVMRCRP